MKMSNQSATSHIVLTVASCNFLLRRGNTKVVLTPTGEPEVWIPTTVIHWEGGAFDQNSLEGVIKGYGQADDIWSVEFLGVIILVASAEVKISNEIKSCGMLVRHTRTISRENLPRGPYFFHSTSGQVIPAVKLLSDFNNAFIACVEPQRDAKAQFTWLQSIRGIAVPSRLCSLPPSKRRPLEGLRFAVKDAIDVAGLETGCGSKCWREHYPPKEQSAQFIDHLIEAGAILIGKLRLTQFCDGLDPLDRFEEITSTNPRGDGFQKPSGSSTGSASSIASYPWLDFTVGTDTGGSIRHPAGVNGVFGIRPSLGAIESMGFTCATKLDSVGLLTRSAAMLNRVMQCLCGRASLLSVKDPRNVTGWKYRLLHAIEPDLVTTMRNEKSKPPKFFPKFTLPGALGEALFMMQAFVKNLEKQLDCTSQEINIAGLWKDSHPPGMDENMTTATSNLYQNIVYHDTFKNTVGPFVEDYKKAHSGKSPYIEPLSKARLEYGSRVTEYEYNKAVRDCEQFAEWVNEKLLSRSREIPLLVYPQAWGRPAYRDEGGGLVKGREIFWPDGLSVYSISYCSGCPDITVPVGEVSFVSKITGTEAKLPVAVSLLAPKGCDLILTGLLTSLAQGGQLQSVSCGTSLY